MVPKGWAGIICGVILIGVVCWMWQSNKADIGEANDIRENGWMYSGTSQITQEQYNQIKKYNGGVHDGSVKITEIEPLTVEYNFGTKDDLQFLQRDKFSGMYLATVGTASALIPVLFIIPLLMILNGLTTIGGNKKVVEEKLKEN
jgi:hypothetical protein